MTSRRVLCILLFICVVSSQGTSPTFFFNNAATASDNAQCSQIGSDIMKNEGGNAIDAAVATTLCLGVLQPYASGIGGGGVALIYIAETQETVVFDFREMAGAAASENMFVKNPELSTLGGKAIAIPGEVAGLWTIWSRYGHASWESILEPAINLAESSIVGTDLAETIQSKKDAILAFPGLRSVFAPNGVLLVEGDTLLQPELANTLREIQSNPMSFYKGQLATELVQDITNAGGILTEADFSYYWDYGVVERHPVSVYYQGYKVIGAPPPFAGGLVMGLALNLIEPYNFAVMTNESSLAQHYMIEAWKWAYSDRMAIADPAYVDMDPVMEAMLSKDHAAILRQQFSSTTTYPPAHYVDLVNPVEASILDSGTSHLSAVDAKGNVVALTSTVNLSFGSKILSPKTGVVLNNEMDDFSTPNQTNFFGQPPSQANFIAPYKKPLSSMTPTLVMQNGKPFMSTGGSGGTKITTATMQVLLGVVAWQESVGQAVTNPRCHNQNTGDTTVESNYPEDFISFLQSTDHIVEVTNSTLAVVQAIVIGDDGLYAASDWRKHGVPAGY